MQIGSRSDTGRVREHNEDAHFVLADAGLVAVLDGLGGHAAGEVASSVASESLVRNLGQAAQPDLALALQQAHRDVVACADTDPARSGMGTTAVVARFRGTQVEVAHVGDSRAYVLTAFGLRPLTTDHSVGGYITQALGIAPTVAPDVTRVELEPDDRLLLCTDGLTNMLDDAEIEQLLRAGPRRSPQQQVDSLVQAALDRGGLDNVTVVLVEP